MNESPQPNVIGSGSLRTFSPLFWCLVAATGMGAGVAGGLLMKLLHIVQHVSWLAQTNDSFLTAVEHASPLRTVAVLTAAGLLVAGVRFFLRSGNPGARGGELTEAIWFRAGSLDPIRTAVRAILSIIVVGMGASLGREAAPQQTGGLIASLLAVFGKLPAGQKRILTAFGAGAGIAAVYNVPLGGAMFSLEVLLGTISLPLVPPALAASLIATIVAWQFLPNGPTYSIPPYTAQPDQIIWAFIAGPIAGLASAVYVRLIAWADAHRPQGFGAIFAPICIFAILGLCALFYPQLLGNGQDIVQQSFAGEVGLPLLIVLVLLKPLATAACLGSGAPGGLFTPTLTFGALLGGLLGHLWLLVWPGSPAGSFAIIGGAAVLAASMQGPISAVIMLLELTRRLDTLMVPVILAVTGAVLVARQIESRSIYSGRIHLGREAAEEKGTKDFIAVSAAACFSETLRAAIRGETEHKPVYVMDSRGARIGELCADQLRDPAPDFFPLETATAGDFARPLKATPVD